MGVVATPPLLSHSSSNSNHHPISIIKGLNSLNSMSQSFHPGIYNFSNGFDVSLAMHQDQNPQHQSQGHKLLSLRGFEQPAVAPPSLVGIGEEEEEEEEGTGEIPVYETGGMLSEMFNFQSAAAAPPAELLDNQIPDNFHRLQRSSAGAGNDWYGSRHGSNNNNSSSNSHHIAHQNHQITSMNADSAAAMQLFLMKPQPRSPSPPPPAAESSSTQLHFLLPNQSTATSPPDLQGFHTAFDSTPIHPPQFTWVPDSSRTGGENTAAQINSRSTKIDGAGDSQVQGLSLSLSPLQHLEAAKAEELRMGDGTMLYFNQGAEGGAPSASSFQLKNLESHQQQFQLQGLTQNHHVHVGFSPSLGMVNVLRNSKYLKAAQELLEEFCSVGRGQLRSNRVGRSNNNTNPNSNSTAAAASAGSSSSSKDLPPLSAADRIQYQRRKAALLSILDEVDRRYNHYCSQMQMVVNSFDSIMGYGAARPYTALAQKAMSRHFRCLKDAIGAQLKQTRELLGEKEGVGASGITKGETPKLKFIDQSLRQQRAFHQMGMMEQEAWRPQRGLPERSVHILRAWLFEHFLHPYPSDADKHLLARQTGLSRNQVSNWFINARVRLWKPMVEDMYQQEGKEEDNDDGDPQEEKYSEKNKQGQSSSSAQTTTTTTQPTTTTTTAAASKRSEIDALDNDPSVLNAINNNNNNNTIQRFSENQASGISQSSTAASTINIPITPQPLLNHHHHHHQHHHHHHHHDVSPSSAGSASSLHRFPPAHHHLHQHHQHQQQQLVSLMEEEARRHGGGGGGGGNIVMDALAHYGASTAAAAAVAAANPNIDSSLLMFGSSGAAATGDVSLTLGLRHAGNLPDNNRFPLSDFGSC